MCENLSNHSNEELFGLSDYSDTNDTGEESISSIGNKANGLEAYSSSFISFKTFSSILGLVLYEDLLSHEQQNELVDGIIKANYFNNLESNQAMCFGTLPSFILRAVEIISNTPGLFPDEIQNRKPLFDHEGV